MKKMLPAISALLLLMLTACSSSGPKVEVESDRQPGIKLKEFDNWDFMQPLGTDLDGDHTLLSSRLMNSMMVEMSERRLRRLTDDPALLVDFTVTSAQSSPPVKTDGILLQRTNWSRSYSSWPDYPDSASLPPGTLIIDLIDAKNNTVVAVGVAEGQVPNDQISQGQLTALVRAIMKDIW